MRSTATATQPSNFGGSVRPELQKCEWNNLELERRVQKSYKKIKLRSVTGLKGKAISAAQSAALHKADQHPKHKKHVSSADQGAIDHY